MRRFSAALNAWVLVLLAGCQDFSRFDTESACATANVVFCDGFEKSAIDPWWQKDPPGGSATIDRTRAYRGRGSLHLHSDPVAAGNSSRQELFEATAETTISQSYFLRVFVYLASPAPMTKVPLLIVELNQGIYPGVTLAIVRGQLALINSTNTSGSATQSGTSLPTDTWTCLELEVEQAAKGSLRAWLDGVEVPELSVEQNTQPPSPLNEVAISMNEDGVANSEPAHDLWFDEFALDRHRVGCSK